MTTTEKSSNDCLYKIRTVKVGGNTWELLSVSGKLNYISVCKKTNNPFGGKLGKDFRSFDEAVSYYKNPQMKVELLKFELELPQIPAEQKM